MSELFLTVLNMSISAGWIVLAVVLLRLLLKKAPKWITVALWAIVAIRLVLPVTVESVMSLIPSTETVSPEIMLEQEPQIHSGIPAVNLAINPVISETTVEVSPEKTVNILHILTPIFTGVWLVGMGAMLLYTLISYLRVKKTIGTAVRLRDNIYQSETVVSPFVLGILKPRIYLPFAIRPQDLNHVLAHEQAHIRRRDYLWKPLGFLLLTVHWFNPLLWLGYILLCRDIELACDEKVVKGMDREERANYSQALLACSVNRRVIAACPLAFGEGSIKNRVKSVLNYKKPAFWIILVAIVASIVVAVCFLTDPVKEPEQTEPIEQTEQTPQGTAITWNYLPMASFTRNSAFYFDFDTPYERIEAKCTGGQMWSPDADGQPYSTTMTYGVSQSVCWSPYETDPEKIPDRAQVILDIYYEDGDVGYCKIEFTCTERADTGSAVYQVYVTAADQYRMVSYNNGCLICKMIPLTDLTLTEPPDLLVTACDQTLQTAKGNASWIYLQDDGTEAAKIYDSSHPLAQPASLPVLELTPSYQSYSDPLSTLLQFNVLNLSEVYSAPPGSVTVRCWAKDQWYAAEPKSEELSVHTDNGNWYFRLMDGEYIYEVEGTWDTPSYSGTVSYRFRTTSPYMTRYPVIDADSKVKDYYFTTPTHQLQEAYDKEELVITQPHAQLEDGLWVWETYGYLYRLEISGRMRASEKNTTYIILSNTKDITFDQAWKASGYSSLSTDYFDPETAVIVGHRLYD